MKHYLLIAFLVLINQITGAQNFSQFLEYSQPGEKATVFAQGIISTNHHEHSRLEFNDNGNTIYWAVIPVDTNKVSKGESPFIIEKQKIWFVKYENEKWLPPKEFELTKKTGGYTPAFSANKKDFYYRTKKENADPNERPRPSQLWKVKTENGMVNPKAIENLFPVNKGKTFMSFCFASNGNLYFDYGGPNESGRWTWEIYMSEFKGEKYQKPILLKGGINKADINWCPWVAPDESYIIFSSHREGDYGNGDLYISFKDRNGNWMEAINMGEAVNTEMQERFPSVSPDGSYLFFARHIPETYSDFYWIETSILEKLKEKVFN